MTTTSPISAASPNTTSGRPGPRRNDRAHDWRGETRPATVPPVRARSTIVTGASRGLGAALFAAFHAQGDRLLALGRQFSPDQVRIAEDDAGVTLRHTDLSDPSTLPSAEDLATFLAGGDPDGEAVLILNAAVVEPVGRIGTLELDAIEGALRVNLLAPIWLTNVFLAVAPARLSRVRVVYVTSSAAHRPYPGWATYCATKAAAETFMRSIETTPDLRCTVDIVDPGAMDTGMQETLRERGIGLPGHDRMVSRHRAAELAQPSAVADRIIAELFSATHDEAVR